MIQANGDAMIDIDEVARRLGLSVAAVRDMTKRKEIPSYRGKGKTSPYRYVWDEVKNALRNES
jgi:excisionase family DNA binding protein